MKITKRPIFIGHQTVILLSIYKYEKEAEDEIFPVDFILEDDVLNINPNARAENITSTAEDGAKEFVNQLRRKWTPRFMKALVREINKQLKK